MTNHEWLKSLSAYDFAKTIGNGIHTKYCNIHSCSEAKESKLYLEGNDRCCFCLNEWLKEEHHEERSNPIRGHYLKWTGNKEKQ